MVKVPGHVLFPPRMHYRDSLGTVHQDQLGQGGWSLKSQKFAIQPKPESWTFLQTCFQKDRKTARYVDMKWSADRLQSEMGGYGIQYQRLVDSLNSGGAYHTLGLERGIDCGDADVDKRNEKALRTRLEYFRNFGIRLVLVTLPAKRTKLYANYDQARC